MYPTLNFGIIKIPLYITIFLIGFATIIVFARKIGERYNYPKEDILYASLYAGIGIFLGAKFMYFISKLPDIITHFDIYIKYIKNDFGGALNYSFGGLVFYGGLIGALLGAYIYCRQYKMPFTPLLDIFAPLIPFVHGIGRIGCFMAGCCYGIEYHGFGSVQFPENELIPSLDDVPRFPVQLVEATINFIIALILYILMKRLKFKTGQLMGIYIICYTITRYIMEMFRGDKIRGNIGGISTSQIISIILIPIGIVLLHGKWLESRKNNCK